MSGAERRSQVLGIAAVEFANHGLYGASIEAIAHEAGITQAYVFRMFGTKKALFLELVDTAFDRCSDGMAEAAKAGAGARGLKALTAMGAQYYESLADRTTLMLQLQASPPVATTRSAITCGRGWPGCGTRSPFRPGSIR